MLQKINTVLDQQVRPALAAHGGGVELVKYENGQVYVRLEGGCRGCIGARTTIKNGVEKVLLDAYSEITEVIDVTDHYH